MNFVNIIIRKLGKKNYSIDNSINLFELYIILKSRLICLLRGFILKFWLKKSKGLIFVGKNCTISFCHKIIFGKTITLGDNVSINALSENGVKIGNNVSILSNSIIECTGVIRNIGQGLIIGNNVGISQNCFIQVRGSVNIGNNVIMGPNVSIFSENHKFDLLDVPIVFQGESRKGVIIEDGVWIGTRSVILDGVTIGKNSIVAAGSVVNKSFPENSIIAGVPAKQIKTRI